MTMLAIGFGVGVLAGGELACSPSSRETVREIVPPATRALCILLHAITSSGTVDEVCATAEELAPFVPEILARRSETPAAGKPSQSLQVAAVFDAPARPVPRRRGVAWIPLASLNDGGLGLSVRDGGDDAAIGASDGGQR